MQVNIRGNRRGGGVFGLLLVVGMIVLLFWNEGRSVSRLDTIAAGREAVVETDAEQVHPRNDGALVHVVGRAEPLEPIVDRTFGLTASALRLERTVEMYQWEETRRTRDDQTYYEYERVWSERRISSSGFHRSGYDNPPDMLWRSETFFAPTRLGDFRVGRPLLERLAGGERIAPPPPQAQPPQIRANFRAVGDTLYTGRPNDPQVGDYRVRFTEVPGQTVSVLARQSDGTLLPWTADETGGTLAMIEPGAMAPAAMFELAESRNSLMTWGIRLGGAFGMFLGFAMALGSIAAWVPIFRNVARGIATLISAVLAVTISVVVIAIGWFWYRPVFSLILIGAAIAAVIGLRVFLRRREAAQPQPAFAGTPPPPPPPGSAGMPPPPPPPGRQR
jgi:hypothetical protein